MFNKKEYKKKFYLKNKDKYVKKAKENYQKKREEILIKRKNARENEDNHKRVLRLKYHKEYNKTNRPHQSLLAQTDTYKFNQYKSSALRRNYSFNISFEKFVELFHSKCNYCGQDDCRGIDRIDNAIGYEYNNSVGCCEMCNKMKWKYAKNQFLSQIKKIYELSINNK